MTTLRFNPGLPPLRTCVKLKAIPSINSQPKTGVRFQGSFDDPSSWSPMKVIKAVGLAGLGLLGIFGVTGSVAHNPPGVRSVYVNHLGKGTERDPSGQCVIRGEGMHLKAPFVTSNNQYRISEVTVKETFKPLSHDGVKIDGAGKIEDGVDIRLRYKLDTGADPNNPNYAASICNVHTKILGDSHTNGDYQKRVQASFSTDDSTSKELYYQQVQPRLETSIKILSTVVNAEDFHTQREFFSNGLNNGYTFYQKDSSGKEILDKNGNKIVEFRLPSLQEQLADVGVKIEYVEVSTIDPPDVLNEEIQKRATLPAETTNANLRVQRHLAEQQKAKTEAQITNAQLLEKTRGETNSEIEKTKGALLQAEQQAQKMREEAEGYKNQRIAQADGYSRTVVTKAEGEADAKRQEAQGISNSAVVSAEGQAERTRNEGEAEGVRLAQRGEMLTKYPELVEQLRIESDQAAREALAKRLGLMLINPNTTSIDDAIKIGEHYYKPAK